MKTKELEVSTPQGDAGHLRRESQYVFNYNRGLDLSCEISLTMPLRAQSYSGKARVLSVPKTDRGGLDEPPPQQADRPEPARKTSRRDRGR